MKNRKNDELKKLLDDALNENENLEMRNILLQDECREMRNTIIQYRQRELLQSPIVDTEKDAFIERYSNIILKIVNALKESKGAYDQLLSIEEKRIIDSYLEQKKDETYRNYELFCALYKNLYLYGAGQKAVRCEAALRQKGIPFKGFVVTKSEGKTMFLSKPVIEVKELNNEDPELGILIALNPQNSSQVYPVLDYLKIKNYCYFE